MIKNIFPIKVSETVMENFGDIQSSLVTNIKAHFERTCEREHEHSLGGSLILMPGKNEFNLADFEHGQIILDYILEQAKLFWKELNYSPNYEPRLLYTWSSMNPQGGSWKSHNHAPATLGGCFYLDAAPEQGNIVLENPLELVLGYQPYRSDYKDLFFEQEIDAQSGKLLLFPAYLKHRVNENKTDKPRMIIGFDIGYRPIQPQ